MWGSFANDEVVMQYMWNIKRMSTRKITKKRTYYTNTNEHLNEVNWNIWKTGESERGTNEQLRMAIELEI